MLKDDTRIDVVNNTGGGITYRTDMGVPRRWEMPNSVLKIQFGELQQSIAQIGVYNMFAEGMLLIDHDDKDEIMMSLGIPELDEYICTLPEIDELLEGVDYEDLKNVLRWGSRSQTETIISIAANKGVNDANIINIIKDVTGVDITVIEPEKSKTRDDRPERPSRPKRNNESEEVEEKKDERPARKKAAKTKK